jgi:signal transduction histidine kinase
MFRAALSRRTALLAALLLALAAIAGAHALHRLRSVNERATEEALAAIRESVSRQGALLERELASGKDFARYLASLESVRGLLDAGTPESFERAYRDVAAFLLRFPSSSGAVVLDEEGNERLRVERIGSAVAAAPRLLLRARANPERAREGLALPPDGVSISEIEFDEHRVDVAERDRVVLRYVARIEPRAILVLSLYAAPLFEGLRRIEPIPGSEQMLLDRSGDYLVHPDRSLELAGARGAGRTFALDHPEAFERLVPGGEALAEVEGTRFVGAATGPRAGSEPPPWTLVARVPKDLRWSSPSRRSEILRIVAALLASLALLAAVAAILFRLTARERRLLEERDTERRLAEAERLATVGRLTAGVAHEINNPLAAIGNYLTLLEKEGADSDRRRENLGMVRHGFERIRTIVRDLLSFARPRLPRQAPVDLREVLARVERLCAHDGGFRAIRWEFDLGNGLPSTAGDPFALEQVFLNLALNARDAMEERGVLRVSIRREGGEAPRIAVFFDDSGPGVPEALRSRIFEPFFSTRGGTGLGLAVSASIVRAHGGTLRVETAPSGGARFVVTLPLVSPPDSPSSA